MTFDVTESLNSERRNYQGGRARAPSTNSGAEARLLVTFEVPERLVALLGFAPPAPLLGEGARARPP